MYNLISKNIFRCLLYSISLVVLQSLVVRDIIYIESNHGSGTIITKNKPRAC